MRLPLDGNVAGQNSSVPSALKDITTAPTAAEMSPKDYTLKAYKEKISRMNKDQLLSEIAMLNRRIAICKTGSRNIQSCDRSMEKVNDRDRIKVSGSKEELVKRLVDEIKWWITVHFNSESGDGGFSKLIDIDEAQDDSSKDSSETEQEVDDDAISLSDSSFVESDDDKLESTHDEEESEWLRDSEDEDLSTRKNGKMSRKSENIKPNKKQKVESLSTAVVPAVAATKNNDDIVFLSDSSDDSDSEEESDHLATSLCTTSSIETMLISLLMRYQGFDSLRPGQLWAIERVLQGERSLLVMPTGSGKTMCYVLPTIVASQQINQVSLTVVISPLIALMQDQLLKLPPELPGAAFTSSLSTQQAAELSEAVLRGLIKVLFVSPERLCSSAFRRLMRLLQQGQSDNSNPIGLVCVDEAHCLSQWSYNFRPSFLRIKREIAVTLRPRAVLALTATASTAVQQDIATHLGIPWSDSVDQNHAQGVLDVRLSRDNLRVSCWQAQDEEDKREKVLKLLLGEEEDERHIINKKDGETPLTIVYVWRRAEAEALGDFLRASSRERPSMSSRSSSNHSKSLGVAVYHGGMAADQRDSVQRQFDRGNARVIVATVAFGMGIDKADVRRVIHLSLPKSLESYMQEIGRAGRDGNISHCLLMFSREDASLQHSLANSSRLSQFQLLGLLFQLFPYRFLQDAMAGINQGRQKITLSQSLRIKSIENLLDISSAAAETVISLLEFSPLTIPVKGPLAKQEAKVSVRLDRLHLDQVEGRFRVPLEKVRSLAEGETADILVKAIITCNDNEKIRQEKEKQSKESRDNATSFFADERIADSLITSNNRSIEQPSLISDRFSLSRSRLAQTAGLDIDDASRGLYRLQQRGLIEYSLSEQAIHLDIELESPLKIELTSQQYIQWIVSLSDKLFNKVDRIVDDASESVLRMWRIAHSLSVVAPDKSPLPQHSSLNEDDRAHVIQRFLGKCVVNGNAVRDPTNITYSDPKKQAFGDALEKGIQTAPSPFAILRKKSAKESSESGGSAVVELAMVTRRVMQDPSITALLKRVSGHCLQNIMSLPPTGTNTKGGGIMTTDLKLKLTAMRTTLIALYVAKALHGLATIKAIDNSYWSSGVLEGAFGSFKTYHFKEVFDEVYAVLTRVGNNTTDS